VQVGNVPSDSVAASSFDWWSGCGNDMFQNRYWKRDLFKMRKIDPRSGICAEMRLIRLNKVWLPCGDAYNWYSGLKCCIGRGFDSGFVRRSRHWRNQGHRLSWDWLSELNLGLLCLTRLASVQRLRVYGHIYMSEPHVIPTAGSATSNPFTNVCSCKFYNALVCCPFQCSPGFG
jgi:hypothetical protein